MVSIDGRAAGAGDYEGSNHNGLIMTIMNYRPTDAQIMRGLPPYIIKILKSPPKRCYLTSTYIAGTLTSYLYIYIH